SEPGITRLLSPSRRARAVSGRPPTIARLFVTASVSPTRASSAVSPDAVREVGRHLAPHSYPALHFLAAHWAASHHSRSSRTQPRIDQTRPLLLEAPRGQAIGLSGQDARRQGLTCARPACLNAGS